MANFQNLIPAAFVLAVLATGCERDPVHADTYTQPHNMPAPAETPAVAAAPAAPASRDSIATRPLDDMTKKKENVTMPEAGHGNNHSSPAFKKSSSTVVVKGPRTAWI